MGRMQATIKETQVRLKDMAVAYKLWAVVLGGMVAMLGLSSGLLWFAERTDAHTRHITEAADARIAITMRWKALTELSTERFLVSATSTEPSMVRDMALLSRKNNVQIAELQKQVEAVAVTPRERAHMEKLLRNRAEFLRIALQLHELREAGQVQEATAMAQSTLRPATQAFLALQDELVHLQEQLREEVRQQALEQRRSAWLRWWPSSRWGATTSPAMCRVWRVRSPGNPHWPGPQRVNVVVECYCFNSCLRLMYKGFRFKNT